jgi:hypothetical protein
MVAAEPGAEPRATGIRRSAGEIVFDTANAIFLVLLCLGRGIGDRE